MIIKHFNATGALLCLSLFLPQAQASLDLLAGVEAGIETDTSMTNPDLERTQQILSSQQAETSHAWQNTDTGIAYQINIKRSYTYGSYPCLAYDLTIIKGERQDIKSLDACQHRSGKWISVVPNVMAF
ncbi:MAG: hypothetical protein RQ732_08140 [Methylophaga sp.]|nr:hypothetical protein [Methylophaga sp.]